MSTQKGIAPILIVLIIAVLIGGFLVYQNQKQPAPQPQQTVQPTLIPSSNTESTDPAETASWKIYTNTKVGYIIKYPSSFSNPIVPGGGTKADGTEDNGDQIAFYKNQPNLSFYLDVRPYGKTLTDLANNYKKSEITPFGAPGASKVSVILLKNINVDGIPAEWYVTRADNGKGKISDVKNTVLFITKNHAFMFIYSPYNTNQTAENAQEVILMKQILSTFKFLP